MKIILIIVTLLVAFQVTHARDPNVPEPPRYGEWQKFGEGEWSGGDTFLAITIPLAIAALIILPHVFDGECRDWPVYKFRLHLLSNVNKTGDLFTKFPTRRLCGSY